MSQATPEPALSTVVAFAPSPATTVLGRIDPNPNIWIPEARHRANHFAQVWASKAPRHGRALRSDPDDAGANFQALSVAYAELGADADCTDLVSCDGLIRRVVTGLVALFVPGVHATVGLLLEADSLWLAPDRRRALVLIASELVTNSLKHAFPIHRGGLVNVVLRVAGDQAELVVEDDGSGLDAPKSPGAGGGLVAGRGGLLAASVDVARSSRSGLRTTARFPIVASMTVFEGSGTVDAPREVQRASRPAFRDVTTPGRTQNESEAAIMKPSQPVILVLGGSGQIGGAVLSNLAGTGVAVRALIRDPATIGTVAGNLQVVRGDYGDPDGLASALKGVDTLMMIGKFEPRLAELQIGIVQAAAAAGVRHVVQSSGVFADPASPAIVQRWLGQVEQSLRDSGMAWTIMRPSFFMQNFLPQAARVADEGVLTALVGDSRVTPIDTRDIGAVYAAVLAGKGHEGKVYELTGSEQLTHGEVAARMSAVLGKPVRLLVVDAERARADMLKSGAAPIMAEAAIDGQRFRLSGGIPPLTDTVERLLGRPPILLDRFLRDHLARFQPGTGPALPRAA